MHEVRSPQAIRTLGRRLIRTLAPGTIVGLDGPLGAGKTVLVKGMAEALGVDPRSVTSASFTLCRSYATDPPLVHIDLYRLDDPAEMFEAGLVESIRNPGGAVVAVEWFEKLDDLRPSGCVRVRIDFAEPGTRRVEITAPADSGRPGRRVRRCAGGRRRTPGRAR